MELTLSTSCRCRRGPHGSSFLIVVDSSIDYATVYVTIIFHISPCRSGSKDSRCAVPEIKPKQRNCGSMSIALSITEMPLCESQCRQALP